MSFNVQPSSPELGVGRKSLFDGSTLEAEFLDWVVQYRSQFVHVYKKDFLAMVAQRIADTPYADVFPNGIPTEKCQPLPEHRNSESQNPRFRHLKTETLNPKTLILNPSTRNPGGIVGGGNAGTWTKLRR